MKKQVLLLILALLPMVVWGYDLEYNGIYYNYVEGGVVVAPNPFDGYSGDVVIPDRVEVKTNVYSIVVGIDKRAFYKCENLGSVEFKGDRTISIGDSAFYGCKNLFWVLFSKVDVVGKYAFTGCRNLRVFFNTIITRSIGESAFWYCSSLRNIPDLSNSLEQIRPRAFEGCSELSSITIPGSVIIGKDAFHECRLKSVTVKGAHVMPLSVDAFDYSNATLYVAPLTKESYAAHPFWGKFDQIEEFSEIFFEDPSVESLSVEAWDQNRDGVLTVDEAASVTDLGGVFTNSSILSFKELQLFTGLEAIGNEAFYGCKQLTSFVLPSQVTTIGDHAFGGCLNLPDVTLPAGVTNIGDGAFSSCDNLVRVTVKREQPVPITEHVFTNRKNALLFVPAGCEAAYLTAEYWKEFRDILDANHKLISFADANVKRLCVANWDTRGNGELSYTEAAAVTDLGTVFQNNKTISKFPELQHFTGLKSLAADAFYGCSSLEEIAIPEGVKTIGESAFEGCSSLEKVIVKDVYTWLGISFANLYSNPLWYAHQLYQYNGWKMNYLALPTGMTSIGDYACAGWSGLTSCNLYNGLETIGKKTFYGCTGLKEITIPRLVADIGEGAFDGCTHLTTVRIESDAIISKNRTSETSLQSIFGNQVQEYIVGQDVTGIGDYAFSGCSGMYSVAIYKTNYMSWTIGEGAFTGCTRLEKVKIPKAQTWCWIQFKDQFSNPLYYARSLSDDNGWVTELEIPENLYQGISDYAFVGWRDLTTVKIPQDIRSIGASAFSGCSSLTKVTIERETPLAISEDVFSNRSNAILYVPADCKEAYQAADYWKEFKAIRGIGETISTIDFADSEVKSVCVLKWDEDGDGELSFSEAAAVTDLGSAFKDNLLIQTFDELKYFTGLTSLAEKCFMGCTRLTSITLPESIEEIGYSLFNGCTALTSVNLPDSVKILANYTFAGCTSLASIKIPKGVQRIGDYAFSYCSKLASVDIPEGVLWIGAHSFIGCSSLAALTIPESVVIIGPNAFEYCHSLTTVTIPQTVKSVGDHAFWDTGLNSVTINSDVVVSEDYSEDSSLAHVFGTGVQEYVIGEGVTTIGKYAFSRCSSLTTISLPSSLKSAGMQAFYLCSELQKVVISDLAAWCDVDWASSMANPLYYAHHLFDDGDAEIVDLVIPDGVKRLKFDAFYSCRGLESVTIPNSVTYFGSYVFYGCNSLVKVSVAGETPVKITENVFTNRANAVLYVPQGSKAAYEAADYWKEFQAIVETDASAAIVFTDQEVKALCVAEWDANGDGELSVNEAAAVTDLGEVFREKTTITAFPELQYFTGLTSIGMGAFYHCEALSQVVVPDGVTSIDGFSFQGCMALSSIVLPEGVTSIGQQAFCGCSNLEKVAIPEGVTTIGGSAFYQCTSLASVSIPNSVTTIDGSAFYQCSSLTSITLPAGLETMGRRAFYDCAGLTKIVSKIAVPSEVLCPFNVYTATLYVPAGTKARYEAASGWQNFTTIREQGDANGDGNVTITDAVAIVNRILGNGSDGFDEDAADVNGDKAITITDAVGVVNIILSSGTSLD